jgi:hypothetical protein
MVLELNVPLVTLSFEEFIDASEEGTLTVLNVLGKLPFTPIIRKHPTSLALMSHPLCHVNQL